MVHVHTRLVGLPLLVPCRSLLVVVTTSAALLWHVYFTFQNSIHAIGKVHTSELDYNLVLPINHHHDNKQSSMFVSPSNIDGKDTILDTTVTKTPAETLRKRIDMNQTDDNADGWTEQIAEDILAQALAMMRTKDSPPFAFHPRVPQHDGDYQAANDSHVVPLTLPMQTSVTALQALMDDLNDDVNDDGNLNHISCGTYKCFFPSRSHPSTGWLVAYRMVELRQQRRRRPATLAETVNADPTHPRTTWHGMWYGWTLAQIIHETHPAVTHFYLLDEAPLVFSLKNNTVDPPQVVQHIQRTWLDKVDRLFRFHYPNGTDSKSTLRLFDALDNCLIQSDYGLVAQRLQRAPPTVKVIKKMDDFYYFYKVVRPDGYYHDRPVTPSFLRNVLHGLQHLRDTVQAYPMLWHDFQFAVNRLTGRIYHVDLDRPYEFFQNYRPTRPRYERYRQRQEPLVACFWHRCAAEIIVTALDFTNKTTTVSTKDVEPNPMQCQFIDGRPP